MQTPLRALFLGALVTSLAAAGCGSSSGAPAGGGGQASTGGQGQGGEGAGGAAQGGAGGQLAGGGGAGGAGGDEGPPMEDLETLSGDLTWAVTFDDAAKAAGATDCSYTRHYEAIEDRSAPWFCPSCEVVFRATVEMTQGQDDCFSQISTTPPLEVEWLGYADGVWYRGVGGPMSAQGTVTDAGGELEIVNQVLDLEHAGGGFFQFDVQGSMITGAAVGDPMNGFNPPATYACGWTKASPAPPPYEGDYTIAVGGTLPDGVFYDRCEEAVRLHDLAGSYLLVVMSAYDCPACQTMAGGEEDFVADMAAQGIPVHVVTLLAPSLADTLGETSTNLLTLWTNKYDVTSPVIADRGFGLSMFLPVFADGTAYPTWLLASPTLEILDMDVGFSSFADVEDTILAHAQ